MPENTKKSRSDLNREKRTAFYKKLCEIDFDFDPQKISFDKFKDGMQKQNRLI